MRPRADLVRELADGLRPVRRPLSPLALAFLWLGGTWSFVVTVTLTTGDVRPGAFAQLAASPRFAGEMLLGLLAGVVAIYSATDLGIPRPTAPWRRIALATLMMAGWVGSYVYGLWDPTLEPSMLGKRPGCNFEVLLFAAPPAVAAAWIVRRSLPLARVWTGGIMAAAAAAVPALFMQLACMYDPAHILSHHLAPVALAAVAGGLLGPVVFRRL
jgi:hypothetical protein